MPPWIVEALSKLSPEGTATSFLGSLATLIALVIVRVMQERKKLDKAMRSVPPTVCPVPEPPKRPSEGTVVATARRIWELEHELADARARLAALDADRKAVAADAVRTAAALAESERRNESLAGELVTLRKEIEGGHTRLPLSESHIALRPVDVVELDGQPLEDKPTPTQGRARVRR